MRSGLFGSLTALLAGAGMALAQSPRPSAPTHVPQVLRPAPVTTTAQVVPPSQVVPPAGAPAVISGPTAVAPAPITGQGVVIGDPVNGGLSPLPDDGGVLGEGDSVEDTDFDVWCRAEYLLWRVPSGPLPPIQTIIPFSFSGVPSFESNFALTSDDVDYCSLSGVRLTAGCWLEPGCFGVECSFFGFAHKNQPFAATSVADLTLDFTPDPIIIAPLLGIFEIPPPTVTQPFDVTTRITGSGEIKELWGTEANARFKRTYIGPVAFDCLAGCRHIRFVENFNLNEDILLRIANPITVDPGDPPPIPRGPPLIANLVQLSTRDFITAGNTFYGAQVGMSFEWCVCPNVVVTGFGKLAVGGMYEVINVYGTTATQTFRPDLDRMTGMIQGPSTPGPVTTRPGGLLTPGQGPIRADCSKVAWVPELNCTLGYLVTDWMRCYVGYNLLYLSRVARAGEQIAFTQTRSSISLSGPAQDVTVIQPGFHMNDTHMKLEGLVAGCEFRF